MVLWHPFRTREAHSLSVSSHHIMAAASKHARTHIGTHIHVHVGVTYASHSLSIALCVVMDEDLFDARLRFVLAFCVPVLRMLATSR